MNLSEGNSRRRKLSRVPITVIFIVNGALYSNWVPRIPAVTSRLNLAENELGLALLCVAAGLLLAQPIVSAVDARMRSSTTTVCATVACCVALPLPGYASSLPWLAAALFALGFANGALDVSMNTYAVEFERSFGSPIIASLHGSVSIGLVLGGLTGAAAAGAKLSPASHLTLAGVALLSASALSLTRLPKFERPVRLERSEDRPGLPVRHLAGLGLMALGCLLAEGAVADWSALYLMRNMNAGPGLAGAGFVGFMVLMTLGRLFGDRLQSHCGAVALARWGAMLGIGGLLIALTTRSLAISVLGFSLMGGGLSSIFPIILRAAAAVSTGRPAAGIAFVSTNGYFGFLVGPAMVGFLAIKVGLAAALLSVAVGLIVVVIFANLLSTSSDGNTIDEGKIGL